MQADTRRLTVARDHLQAAYEEITRAIGLTERSMAEQAAARGKDQLDLVIARLQNEAAQRSGPGSDHASKAFAETRRAWQSLFDALNDWEMSGRSALDSARESVLRALDSVDQAEHAWRERLLSGA